MTAQPFTETLAQISDIPDLSSDPTLIGGGLHETFPGGFLGIHADFNIHPQTGLFRRLNLLIYLNEPGDWDMGALELWEAKADHWSVMVEPIAGRSVVFATSDGSFHGHPHPLECPAGVTRRSLALYYYSATPPADHRKPHGTLYFGEEQFWDR